MKYIIILGDGMADEPIARLGNRTPLQAAKTPYMDLLAQKGRSGLLDTIPEGMHPGSEIANLSVLGYDVPRVYEGRGVLEAASMGVDILPDEMAMRLNLVCIDGDLLKNHSAGHISTEEAAELIRFLNEKLGNDIFSFHAGVSYRNLLKMKGGNKNIHCTPPHDVPEKPFMPLLIKPANEAARHTANELNKLTLASQKILADHPINKKRIAEGKDPANSIWMWSPGYRPAMQTLKELYPIKSGSVISAVDLIKGIGVYAGLDVINVEGATGLYDTNYEGKAQAALAALREQDFVYLHIEASDEAGHEGDVDLKIKTIENLDARVVKTIFEEIEKWDEPVTIAVLPDHPTPCAIRTHTRDPIPFVIYHKQISPDDVKTYDEMAAKNGSFGLLRGDEFMKVLFEKSEVGSRELEEKNNKNLPPASPSFVERGKGRGYYSTNKTAPIASFQEAVVKGLAPDKGLYMPEKIGRLPESFFAEIGKSSLVEIAQQVADEFFGDDIPKPELNAIVADTLNFDIPLVKVEDDMYVLELFHGPTFAFKDVGARFMARILSYFVRKQHQENVNVLVATSGDTGSAVANGFLGVKGIRVFVLYPSGKVSDIQEAQFTTLGQNITALEIDGTFDNCQALVKSAFMDEELNLQMNLTSANSINVARFLPQSFYYFHAYAQLAKQGISDNVIVSVPSGNLGNLTAGIFAKRMGLPINRFIAANNRNDVFYEYLQSGNYNPRASVQTVANAMDVGAPSNFDRILELYNHSHDAIRQDISGYRYSDQEITSAIKRVYEQSAYLLDPHGACAYLALKEGKQNGETGIFLATAHPAKFKETVENCIGKEMEIPQKLAQFMKRKKQSLPLSNDFQTFKKALINLS